MLEGKAVIGETDMLQTMQQDAHDLAAKALDFFDFTIFCYGLFMKALYLKQEFDRTYRPGLAILLFMGSAVPEAEANQFSALEGEIIAFTYISLLLVPTLVM
ncbi:hypothetical protein CRYUN_Cryun39dG0031600 [Craigia yunnanensis]